MTVPHVHNEKSRRIIAKPVPAFSLYGEPLQVSDQRLIHVEPISVRSRLHDWTILPHLHLDLHQVLFIERGHVVAQVDGVVNRLSAPAVLSFPPGAVHALRFDPGAVGLVATFASGFVDPTSGDLGSVLAFLGRMTMQALEASSVHATDLPALAAMLLRESARSAPGRHTALRGLLTALLANLCRLVEMPAALASSVAAPSAELVARFRREIEAHYREHLHIGAYASCLRVSTQRLRRACVAAAGVAPRELVHQRVLIEAERQLRYTALSISEIAYYLGFDDPAYFARFFAGRTHMSPRAFREGKM